MALPAKLPGFCQIVVLLRVPVLQPHLCWPTVTNAITYQKLKLAPGHVQNQIAADLKDD